MVGKLGGMFAIVFVASVLAMTGSGLSKEQKHNQGFVMVIHKVENYENFKKVFKAHDKGHKKAGLKDHEIFQDANDPNNVIIIFKTKDLAKAKAYFDDPKNQEMMKEAKIVGKPELVYMHKAK